MPTTITIQALTLNDLRYYTAGELSWNKPQLDRMTHCWLPHSHGVYAWVGPKPKRAVLYIGKASGKHGLRQRLGYQIKRVNRELRRLELIRQDREDGIILGPDALPYSFLQDTSAHPRVLAERNASLCWAEATDAAKWEQRLIYVSVYDTGYAPALNGYAWQLNRAPQGHAQRWARAAVVRRETEERRRIWNETEASTESISLGLDQMD